MANLRASKRRAKLTRSGNQRGRLRLRTRDFSGAVTTFPFTRGADGLLHHVPGMQIHRSWIVEVIDDRS